MKGSSLCETILDVEFVEMQIKCLSVLALFRRSHELLFIYVFGERSDTALPKFVTTTQNANFKRETCLRDSGSFVA